MDTSSYAVRRPIANPYLVRERDRRRTRELVALLLATVPPMAVLFAAIWANVETVKLGYQLERLTAQREMLVKKRRALEGERAYASSLRRVEDLATSRLGLAAPERGQVIHVRDGSLGPALREPEARKAVEPDLIGPPAPVLTEEGF